MTFVASVGRRYVGRPHADESAPRSHVRDHRTYLHMALLLFLAVLKKRWQRFGYNQLDSLIASLLSNALKDRAF